MAAAVASSQDYVASVPGDAGLSQMQGGHLGYQQVVLSCNKDGMDFLRKGQYKQAFEQLKYAEAVLISSQQDEPTNLLAMTSNNLGCYYKKVGKLHAALSYLRKALKIEVSMQTDDVTVAGTHLNICAILSKLEKHDKAVQHALCALELISNRVNAVGSVSQDDYSVLAIAYHNVAVERDYLHQWDEAADAYMQGHEVAKKCLGDQHPLTQTLRKNSDEALQKSRRHRGRVGVAHVPAKQRDQSPMLPDIASARGARERDLSSTAEQLPGPTANPPPAIYPEEHPPSQGMGDHTPAVQSPTSTWTGPAPQLSHTASGLQFSRQAVGYETPRRGTQSLDAGPMLTTVPSLPPVGDPSFAAHWMHPHTRDPPLLQETPAALQEPLPQVPPAPSIPSPASPPPLVMSKSPRPDRVVQQEKPPEPSGLPEQAFQAGSVPGRNGRPPPGPAARALRQAERERNKARLAVNPQPTAAEQQIQLVLRNAAIKIQRSWREHFKYKQNNKELREQQMVAATMIQARWRTYHIRRVKFDKVAALIQRNVRRWLVKRMMAKKKAIVVMQAHLRAFMCRTEHQLASDGATHIQRVARGMRARRFVKNHQAAVMRAVRTIQAGAHGMRARRRVRQIRAAHRARVEREQAATRIQKVWRGMFARRQASAKRVALQRNQRARQAAIKLQTAIRRYLAIRKVGEMRHQRRSLHHAAATTIRKYWLRLRYQRRYKALRNEFLKHQDSVVTIQRYMRGFLVRLRLWREALRNEEELWAAREIQRIWRGYIGRVKWEMLFETTLSRQKAAQKLQRYVRGWLARTRVHRVRRRRARQDFERARKRFKAAQKIQALVRGHLGRRRVAAHRAKIVWAATTIQRMTRGHQVRVRLWEMVRHKSATRLQAAGRGHITRRRRVRAIVMAIHIQRTWRQYRGQYSKDARVQRSVDWRRKRKQEQADRVMK